LNSLIHACAEADGLVAVEPDVFEFEFGHRGWCSFGVVFRCPLLRRCAGGRWGFYPCVTWRFGLAAVRRLADRYASDASADSGMSSVFFGVSQCCGGGGRERVDSLRRFWK
jgi:hypothetical protein